MITYHYRSLRDKTMHVLDSARAGVWILAENPTSTELDVLAQNYKLDRDILADAVDPFEAPRLEIDEGIVYMFARFPLTGDEFGGYVATAPVLFVVTDDAVLTIAKTPFPYTTSVTENHHIATTQKIKLVLYLFDQLARGYSRELIKTRKDVRRYYVNPKQVQERDVFRFIDLESRLNDYMSALTATGDVLSEILKGKTFRLYEDDIDLVRDLELSADQSVELCNSTLRTITNLREVYGVVAANRLNRVIRILTVLTVLLTIPTMITSFFGMNVPLPFAENPYASGFVILVSLGLGLLLFAAFKYQKWM